MEEIKLIKTKKGYKYYCHLKNKTFYVYTKNLEEIPAICQCKNKMCYLSF